MATQFNYNLIDSLPTDRPPDKSVYQKIKFLIFLTKTYVVDAQKNRLIETVLLSTQNISLNCLVRKQSQYFMLKKLLNWPYNFAYSSK